MKSETQVYSHYTKVALPEEKSGHHRGKSGIIPMRSSG